MILTMQADGTLLTTVPERVFQGSNNANTVAVVANIARTNDMVIAYKLPQSGVWTAPVQMTLADNIDELTGYNVWSIGLDEAITQEFGNVELQVKAINASGQVIASALGSFIVERGVPPVLPVTMTNNVYEQILANLQDIRADLTQVQTDLEQAELEIGNKQDLLTAGEGITISEEDNIATVAVDFNVAQKKLVAGQNITIDEQTNTISASGGSGSAYTGKNGILIENSEIGLDPAYIQVNTVLENDTIKIAGYSYNRSKENQILMDLNGIQISRYDIENGAYLGQGLRMQAGGLWAYDSANGVSTDLINPIIAGDNVSIERVNNQIKVSASGGGALPSNIAYTDTTNTFTARQDFNRGARFGTYGLTNTDILDNNIYFYWGGSNISAWFAHNRILMYGNVSGSTTGGVFDLRVTTAGVILESQNSGNVEVSHNISNLISQLKGNEFTQNASYNINTIYLCNENSTDNTFVAGHLYKITGSTGNYTFTDLTSGIEQRVFTTYDSFWAYISTIDVSKVVSLRYNSGTLLGANAVGLGGAGQMYTVMVGDSVTGTTDVSTPEDIDTTNLVFVPSGVKVNNTIQFACNNLGDAAITATAIRLQLGETKATGTVDYGLVAVSGNKIGLRTEDGIREFATTGVTITVTVAK